MNIMNWKIPQGMLDKMKLTLAESLPKPQGDIRDPKPFGGIKPPEGPEYQDAMDSWNEAMGNETEPAADPDEDRKPPLWNGIKPPDWAPEETQQAWRDSIGKPMQPGRPAPGAGTLGNSAADGSRPQTGSLRRSIERKRTLLSGGG